MKSIFACPEVEDFLKEFLEDIFPNSKVELIKKFYTPDVKHF